nr:methylesterase 10-like [Tanacetum cinerariifolium]
MERFSHVSAAVFISAYMPNSRDPPALQMKQYFKNLKPEMFMDCRFTFNKNGLPASAELGDPKNGSDQARETFWYQILGIYNTRAEELGFKKRNKNILTGKWTPVNKDVGKFNAIYDQTTTLSGENDDNLYTRVLTLFRDQNNVEFRHQSACLFLKDKYKWQNPESTQARRTRGQLIEEEPEMFGDDAIPRPSGAPRKTKSQHKYKWRNPESTQARRTRGQLIEDEPEMFGDDAIPRPSGAPRKTKSQRSSANSSATSSSSKNRVADLMQEQILIDREAKKESMDNELAARLAVCEIQKRNEDLKILTFETTGMAPENATKIEALKEKARATYFNF